MAAIPGFPSNDYDWNGQELAQVLAGLIVRDAVGVPRAGVMPSRADLVKGRPDWFYDVQPFVAVRVNGRSIIMTASADIESVPTSPPPSSNARIDVIYSLPADVEAADPVEAVFVKQGVAAAVPTKPALPAGAVELSTARVSAGNPNTAAAVVTQSFATTVCSGGIIPFRSTAERDAWLAVPGQLALVGDVLWQRSGSTWKRAVPDVVIPAQAVTYRVELAVRDVAAGATVSVNQSFPTNLFPGTPVVAIATPRSASNGAYVTVNNLAKTGCTVHFKNDSNLSLKMGVYLFVSM